MNAARTLAPVSLAERIELLDVLRGLAIFGILPVNMLFFSAPIEHLLDPPWASLADRAALTIINFFFLAKFYSLFSLLFGIGFAIQYERAKTHGAEFTAFWWRRMIALLVIGSAHVALLWYGDILHLYAILGLVLLVFRDHDAADLLRPAAISLAVPILLLVFVMAFELVVPTPAAEADSWTDEVRTAQTIAAYRSADPAVIAARRWRDYVNLTMQSIVFVPLVFGMFLLGVHAWRSGLIRNVSDRTDRLRWILKWSSIIGLPANLICVVGDWYFDPTRVTPATALVLSCRFLAGVTICLVYATGIALLVRRPNWERWLRALAPVGRLALSNYLFQSIVCTAVFYGFGLGLYGSTGPAFGLLLAVGVLAVETALSALWLRWFRFGPIEWLWRKASYNLGASGPRDLGSSGPAR